MAGKTPVTMLSGFLGAGKTSLLRYVLENSTEKIACIVNDVASVNIDAKLVRNDRNRGSKEPGTTTTSDLADTIELANGCACCNLQDELFASFEQVLDLADRRGQPYARIILENSGVAEPQNIRDKMSEAEAAGHPLMQKVELDTLVTVVDCSTFLRDYATKQPLAARPELGDGGNMRPVVDLLVEQVECADFVILNKVDLLDGDKVEQLKSIIATLNPLATIITAQYGQIPITKVFGRDAHAVVAKLNIEAQHRGAVAAAKAVERLEHSHDHDHECSDHACDHPDHKHGHDHKHEHEHHHHDHDHSCADKDCTNPDHHHHHHEHHHHHDHDHACTDMDCTNPDHHHDHDHDHGHKHHHHHKHKKGSDETRAAARFGIKSFVYARRKPFHPQRLQNLVLRWLPVTHNKALGDEQAGEGSHPLQTVIRSKGFFWMSNSHSIAYYWSHAGAHFEIREEGDWWATVPAEDWPSAEAERKVVLADFDLTTKYGDRRQEIVFIGANMEQDKIEEQLDLALLTDEEMGKYDQRWSTSPDPVNPEIEALKAK